MPSNYPTYPSIEKDGSLITIRANTLNITGDGATVTQPSPGVAEINIPNSGDANTVWANPTGSTASLQALALAANTILGRDTGDLTGITIGAGLQLLAGVLSSTVISGFNSANVSLNTFTSNSTYTRPANTEYAVVVCIGGGGGSGGCTGGGAGTSSSSGGGGSGEVTIGFYSASDLGPSASVVIGPGGIAGTPGNAGGNGGVTSFGSLTSAEGGEGGNGATSSSSFLNTGGGDGGTGGLGQVYLKGNDGGNGISFGVNGAPAGGYGAANPFMGGGVRRGAASANTGAGGAGTTATTTNQSGNAGGSGFCFVFNFLYS